jgi:hypothetical protein
MPVSFISFSLCGTWIWDPFQRIHVRCHLKVFHSRHFIVGLYTMFHIEFVDIFMTYLHTKFHRPSSSGILFITNIPRGKYWFLVALILLFYIIENNYHIKNCTYFKSLLSPTISWSVVRFSWQWILRLQSSNDRSSKLLQNIGTYLSNYMASRPRRP